MCATLSDGGNISVIICICISTQPLIMEDVIECYILLFDLPQHNTWNQSPF